MPKMQCRPDAIAQIGYCQDGTAQHIRARGFSKIIAHVGAPEHHPVLQQEIVLFDRAQGIIPAMHVSPERWRQNHRRTKPKIFRANPLIGVSASAKLSYSST